MADHAHSAEELAPYTEEENKIYFIRESDWTQCPAYLFGQEDYLGIGVVVIQEWWGVNHQIIDVAKHVADKGFRTLVPDLYRGKCAIDNENAGHLMDGLNWPAAVQDIKGAVQYLKATGSRKVAVIGFCMGGALSLASAALVPEVDAAVPYYGIPPAQLADVSTIRVPILGHFAELDTYAGFSDPQAARDLTEKLRSANVDSQIIMHKGVGHGFVNPIHGAPQSVIDESWEQTFAFIRKKLNVASVGFPAPHFEEEAVVGQDFKTLKLSDYKGKYLVLFFYPLDFTFVCPTELLAFSDRIKEFQALNTEVVGASVDSKYAHLAWLNTPRKAGGLGGALNYPLIADLRQKMARDYDVLIEGEGHTLRGLFIINPQGVVVQITKNDSPVGRNVDEVLRLVQAFQYVDEHGEVCPVNWTPGAATMKPDPKASLSYFEKAAGFEPSPQAWSSSSSSSAPAATSTTTTTSTPTSTTITTPTARPTPAQRQSESSCSLSSTNLLTIIAGALVGVAVLVGSKKLYDVYRRR